MTRFSLSKFPLGLIAFCLLPCLFMGRAGAQTPVVDLNADNLTGSVSDGAAVTSWTSGSVNFAQATAVNQPIYKANIVAGHAVVRFTGSGPSNGGQYLGASSSDTTLAPVNTGAFTVISVVNFANITSPYQTLLAKCTNGTNNQIWACLYQNQPNFLGENTQGGQVAASTWVVLAWTMTGAPGSTSSFAVYQNGQLFNMTVQSRLGANTTNQWTIGSTDAATNGALYGDVAREQIYSSALTPAQVLAKSQGLAATYGITIPTFSPSVNIAAIGDSIVQGTTNYPGNPSWCYVLQSLLNNKYRVTNFGLGGTQASWLSQQSSNVDASIVTGAANILLVASGTNDLANAGTPTASVTTTALSNYTSFCTARRAAGWKVVSFPIIPRAAGNGGGLPGSAFDVQRLSFNNSVRTTSVGSYADAFCDTVADPALGTINGSGGSGGYTDWAFATGQNQSGISTVFTQDGVHPSPLGNRMFAIDVLAAIYPLIPGPTSVLGGSGQIKRGR